MPGEQRRPRRSRAELAGRSTRPMVHVYLPAQLHQQLTVHEAQTGLSHAEVILDAIEEHHATLLTTGEGPAPLPEGALFARTGYRRPSRATEAPEPVVTIGVRFLPADLTQIDQLVSASTTTSRSAYIVAALRAHLEQISPQENA